MTTDVLLNGHRPRGRAAPALPAFTFPHSGITVGLRRFAADTQDTITREIQRLNPPPDVPVVDQGEELDPAPNPADPDYQQALSDYMRWLVMQVSTKLVELAFRRIVIQDSEEAVALAVAALRDDMLSIGTPIPDDMPDRDVYIRHICVSSTYDLTSMLAYLQGRSMPTEEVIQEFLESFPGRVQGT